MSSRFLMRRGDQCNSYGFVLNDPIAAFDELGLWTTVARNGEATAKVVSDSAADTWFGLALLTGLHHEEYESWIWRENGISLTAGESPTPGCTYLVPNVVYMSVGPGEQVTSGYGSPSTDFATYLDQYVRPPLEAQKFKVIRLDTPPQAVSKKWAHAWVFEGHSSIASGWTVFTIEYAGDIYAVDGWYTPSSLATQLHHKLAWVWIIACGSANQPWENLVSPHGQALLYSGDVYGPWTAADAPTGGAP
jgi:hypothetical protein